MKKKFLTFILTICFIIPCTLLFSACGGNELIYFETVMPSEYEIEIEYTSEDINYVAKFIKKGNEYYGKQDPTGVAYYIDYYVLTNRTEKPYNLYSYNYVDAEWRSVREVAKYDESLFGGTEHPAFDNFSTFETLREIIDTESTPFEQGEYVEDCVVAGRSCVKYRITSSDGSSITYSYDKVNFALLEQEYIDNDGDSNDQSFQIKVTKFLTTVATGWKDTLSLPVV